MLVGPSNGHVEAARRRSTALASATVSQLWLMSASPAALLPPSRRQQNSGSVRQPFDPTPGKTESMSERSTKVQQGIAAVGVILSLVFVGVEIRENTLAVRGATAQAISDQSVLHLLEGAADPDWIRILTRLGGGAGLKDLSPEDQMRYNLRASVTVRLMENRWRQTTLGILGESGLGIAAGVRNTEWYRSEHFRTFWRDTNMASLWEPDFVDFMESEVMGIR